MTVAHLYSRPAARRFAALALTGLVATTLAACGQDDNLAGQSARVGAASLPVSDVHERSEEVVAVAAAVEQPPIDTAALNRAQVGTWVREQLSQLAADREGIEITDGQIDRFLASVLASNGTSIDQLSQAIALQQDFWIPPTQLEAYVRSFLQQQELANVLVPNGSDAEKSIAVVRVLTEIGDDVGVEVSPRFGVWDAENGVVGLPADDLSSPAPIADQGQSLEGLLDLPSQG